MRTNPFSDSEIIAQVLEGNVDAFEELLTRHSSYILGIVKRRLPFEQVEETAHEVFIRAYRSLSSFKGKSDFRRWLSSIAVKTCYDFWRKHYKNRELSLSSLTQNHQEWLDQVSSSQSIQALSEHAKKKEAWELLDCLLEKLSAEDRMVLELVYLEELSEKDTAELLGWSLANVKIRAFRSRQKLKIMLARMDEKRDGGEI